MEEKTRQQHIEEFQQQRKVHASDWLRSIREAKRCEWCGWDDNLNGRGLCIACEKIRRRLAKANKEDATDQRVVSRIRRAESQKQNAMNYGIQLKTLLDGTPSGLNVEHLLTELGERMTGENLFHGDSHEIDWTFDGTQRAILAAILWKILSREAQNHRRYYAAQDRLYSAMRQSR